MVQHQRMTTRLFLICILAFLACSHASNSRGPFGFRNSPSIEVSKSPKRSPFWWSGRHANSPPALLQIRGGDPSTITLVGTTDDDDGGNAAKKADVSVETPSANNITASDEPEEPLNVAKAIEEIEESSDLDTDDEMAEAIELASDDDEEEEDFYTDSEDSDASDYEVDTMIDDVEDEEEGNPALELAIDTAVNVSKRTGVLAIKFSKGASYWIRQWSWDIYRACERAVDAYREEVADGAFDLTLSKAELKDATRAQIFRKKSWKATKCTCTTIFKMTKAFWTMDDNDILPEDDDDDLNVMSILPKFSFLDKFKLRSDVDEEEMEDEEIIEPEEEEEIEEETCKSESSLRKKLRKKRIKKKKKKKAAAASQTTAKKTAALAPKEEDKAVVTVIPRVRKTRRVILGVAVGVACGFLWQEVGAAALIAKGLSALPWKKSADASKEES